MRRPFEVEPSATTGVAAEIVAAAERLVGEVEAAGRWSLAEEEALDLAFERAARRALAAPSIAERALRSRALARRFVPPVARPLLGRLARRVDGLIRRLVR